MCKKITLFLFLLMLTCLLSAQTIQDERLLNVGIESDIDILDPWESRFTVTEKVFWNVFEPLITLEEKLTKIKPNLAISWNASNNNRTWHLKLRKGVKFHDGSSLTADDVVASASLFKDFEAKVEKIDNYTVRFNLPVPNSGFLNSLVDIRYGIAPYQNVEEYKTLKKDNRLIDFIPVGSGPFKFSRWEKGKKVILESFAGHWQGATWIKKVIYQIIPDNKARISALEKGEVDVIDVIFPNDMPRIKKNNNLKIISIYGMNICYVAFNTTRKPLDNVKVRHALNLAIDKLRLSKMFYYGGYGVPTNRIISPAFWGFSALPSPGRYQPTEAKRLLGELGYKTGLNLKLICIPITRPYLPNPNGIAEEIKKQFAFVGLRVDIIMPANFAEFESILRKGDFDFSLSGWINLTGDPDFTLYSLLSCKNPAMNESRWHNKLFDEKLQAACELPLSDVRGRIRLYNEAQKIVQDEVPLTPLFHTKIFVIHHRKVKGIKLYPSTMISYHKVRLGS